MVYDWLLNVAHILRASKIPKRVEVAGFSGVMLDHLRVAVAKRKPHCRSTAPVRGSQNPPGCLGGSCPLHNFFCPNEPLCNPSFHQDTVVSLLSQGITHHAVIDPSPAQPHVSNLSIRAKLADIGADLFPTAVGPDMTSDCFVQPFAICFLMLWICSWPPTSHGLPKTVKRLHLKMV